MIVIILEVYYSIDLYIFKYSASCKTTWIAHSYKFHNQMKSQVGLSKMIAITCPNDFEYFEFRKKFSIAIHCIETQ